MRLLSTAFPAAFLAPSMGSQAQRVSLPLRLCDGTHSICLRIWASISLDKVHNEGWSEPQVPRGPQTLCEKPEALQKGGSPSLKPRAGTEVQEEAHVILLWGGGPLGVRPRRRRKPDFLLGKSQG